jgi:opacity protein-like surface antigen
MLNRFCTLAACACLMIGAAASPAFADITAFLGVSPTPDHRLVRGLAVGSGLVIVGFEFEYADTKSDEESGAPSLKTGMANLLLQTPVPIGRFQPYFTIGGGLYRERVDAIDRQETSFGSNVGGGAKMTLSGPLRLRFDYRLFTLRGDPLYSTVHRFYTGLNLAF